MEWTKTSAKGATPCRSHRLLKISATATAAAAVAKVMALSTTTTTTTRATAMANITKSLNIPSGHKFTNS